MEIEKLLSGAWRICDIIDGYLVQRRYFYMTKREAIRAWKEEFN